MVCDDCRSKLSTVAAPDPWRAGSTSSSAVRRVDENKLLRKGVRQNPYSHVCKICKQKTSQNQAQYCSTCAYAKGVCAICGKVVQDISMYKMSEGGTFGKVRERDPSSFKSPEQLAREEATHELVAHLAAVGQVGRMPTKSMLEGGGKGALAATLIKSYGGLNAAADALGLSKRHLVEEAEARKEARQQAAQKAQEQRRLAAEAAAALAPELAALPLDAFRPASFFLPSTSSLSSSPCGARCITCRRRDRPIDAGAAARPTSRATPAAATRRRRSRAARRRGRLRKNSRRRRAT